MSKLVKEVTNNENKRESKLEKCIKLGADSEQQINNKSNSSNSTNTANQLNNVKIEDIPSFKYNEIQIKEFIGSGGFGKVYKAYIDNGTREVAIKEARVDSEDIELIKKSVYQEAKLSWMLDHPNVIKLYGICIDESHYCLIMEYAKGGSLGRLLNTRKSSLPPSILIRWALQVAYGMYYLHEQASITIIHRDLKSSNILLSEEVVDTSIEKLENIILKLSDFGLAREIDRTTNMTIAGTYRYEYFLI